MAKQLNLPLIFGVAWKIALLLVVLVGAKYTGDWVLGQLTPYLTPSTEPTLHRIIMVATATYTLLMMLPFVPGVEIGMGMMVTFGGKIAPLIYGATVAALTFSYLVGRLVPQQSIIVALEVVRLKRAALLLRNLQSLNTDERIEFLLQNASFRIVPYLLRFKYLALMISLNMPGNAVIGGGGGICMIAGFCRLFSFPGFFIAVALAVAPVPLMVFFTG